MAQAGLPVPPAFVLPTSWCQRAQRRRRLLTQTLAAGIAALETATGLGFGATRRPLLVSVRSGAAVSMPGMMETVLDVGLNLETVEGLIRLTGNPRLAWDSYRRLVQGYAEVVADLPTAPFDALVTAAMVRADADTERELDHRDLRALTLALLECYRTLAGTAFPADPHEQLARRCRGGVPLLGCAEGGELPAHERHQRRRRHRRDCADNGIWQRRRRIRCRRRFHPQSRRPVPASSISISSSMARARTSSPAGSKLRDNDRLRVVLPAVWARLNDTCHDLGGAVRRCAGLRVHRPVRRPVPAAVAAGQAHRLGGAGHRRGHGRGADADAGKALRCCMAST